MNNVFLTGRLTRDGELRAIPSGEYVLTMGFAIREDMRKDTAQPTFVDLVLWGTRAQSLAPYMKKGIFIGVTGRLEVRKTVKDEKTYTSVRVNVNQIEFLSKKEDGAGAGAPEDVAPEAEAQPAPKSAGKKKSAADDEEIPF